MTGVTLDNEDLSDESPTDEPIRLKAVVDFYGPIDIGKMNFEPSTQDHGDAKSPEGMFLGGFNVLENPDKVKPTVPIAYLDKAKEIPPFLIIHGNKDRLVPFGQSVMFYNALKQNKQIRDNGQTRWGLTMAALHSGPKTFKRLWTTSFSGISKNL